MSSINATVVNPAKVYVRLYSFIWFCGRLVSLGRPWDARDTTTNRPPSPHVNDTATQRNLCLHTRMHVDRKGSKQWLVCSVCGYGIRLCTVPSQCQYVRPSNDHPGDLRPLVRFPTQRREHPSHAAAALQYPVTQGTMARYVHARTRLLVTPNRDTFLQNGYGMHF